MGALNGHGELLVRTAAEFDSVLVEIRDSPEYRRRSKPAAVFFTTKPVREGTGLGLDTVYRLVTKHRGQVRVEPEPGRTSFQVRLPFATDSKRLAPFKKSVNPSGPVRSPLTMAPEERVSNFTGEAYRLACLELRGGNRAAVYPAELPGLNAWISCRPLHPATRGGDLYYLSVCSRGSISRITIADVAGHGEDVSTLAERLRDALREHADHWDQSALIRRINDSFLKVSVGGKYATAVLLGHYVKTGELLFTNAGHLPPLWYRAALREWTFLQDATPYSKEIADLPLGLIPGTDYTQTAVQLEPDDLLLLYTDGINESCDESGEQLGLDRLLEIARGLPAGSASAAGEALVLAVAGFRGAAPAADDETVVALHRVPAVDRVVER